MNIGFYNAQKSNPQPILYVLASNNDYVNLEKGLQELQSVEDVNKVRSNLGFTPLHAAVQKNHLQAIRILIKYGSNPLLPGGRSGQDAIDFALIHAKNGCIGPGVILLESKLNTLLLNADDMLVANKMKTLQQKVLQSFFSFSNEKRININLDQVILYFTNSARDQLSMTEQHAVYQTDSGVLHKLPPNTYQAETTFLDNGDIVEETGINLSNTSLDEIGYQKGFIHIHTHPYFVIKKYMESTKLQFEEFLSSDKKLSDFSGIDVEIIRNINNKEERLFDTFVIIRIKISLINLLLPSLADLQVFSKSKDNYGANEFMIVSPIGLTTITNISDTLGGSDLEQELSDFQENIIQNFENIFQNNSFYEDIRMCVDSYVQDLNKTNLISFDLKLNIAKDADIFFKEILEKF